MVCLLQSREVERARGEISGNGVGRWRRLHGVQRATIVFGGMVSVS